MTQLANVIGAERKNQNQKTNGPNLGLSLVLGTANIVIPITNVDNAQQMGKYVRHVVKRTILPKSVDQKANLKTLVVLSTNHLNIGK